MVWKQKKEKKMRQTSLKFGARRSTPAAQSHLGESLHVVADDLGVGTLQLADDFKALIEL